RFYVFFCLLFFFFQAEDGIRDFHVTGVQTCALPISEQMTLRASVGPQVNFNLKKNQATTNADFKPFTFDGLVNIGTDFDRFSVDLRYNHTINKTSAELDSRNRMVGLSVGYRF